MSIQKKRHRHEFHGLWWHWGPAKPQDEHVHDCVHQDCDRILIGEGRACVPAKEHRRAWLGEGEQ